MVYTHYAKTRILYHRKRGLKPYSIQKKLEKENIKTTSGGIANFLKHYNETQSLKRKPGSGRVPKLAKEVKQVIKEQVERNVKISTQELSELLVSKGYDFSERSVERYRALLARGCSDSSRHSDSASTASNEDVILVEVEEPPANPSPSVPQMNSIPQLSAPSSRHTNDVTINSHLTESGPPSQDVSISDLNQKLHHVLFTQSRILQNQELIFGKLCLLESKFTALAPTAAHPVVQTLTAPPTSSVTMATPMYKSCNNHSGVPAPTRESVTPQTPASLPSLVTQALPSVAPVLPVTPPPPHSVAPLPPRPSVTRLPPVASVSPIPSRSSPSLTAHSSTSPPQLPSETINTPAEIRKTYNFTLDSSEIDKTNLSSVEEVVAQYSQYLCVDKAGTLAVKLAREAFFGDSILARCTVYGARGLPGLPRDTLTELKQALFVHFPEFWTEPDKFELLWSNCSSAINQRCNRLRSTYAAIGASVM